MVRLVPLSDESSVLDAACGDGFYSELFAERLAARGRLVALDVSLPFLAAAQRRPALRAGSCTVEFWQGDVASLESVAEPFDLVWCAQSLYSLPDPLSALEHLAKALRPGGVLAVLENDTLHQILLPWPSRLEIALRAAEYRYLSEETGKPAKYYIGRRLPHAFAAVGLQPAGFKTQMIDRQGPVDDDLRQFLHAYLENLEQRVRGYLSNALVDQLRALIDPESSEYLLNDPWFTMSWQNVLAWAYLPDRGSS